MNETQGRPTGFTHFLGCPDPEPTLVDGQHRRQAMGMKIPEDIDQGLKVLASRVSAIYKPGDIVRVYGRTYGFTGVVVSDTLKEVYVEFKGTTYKLDRFDVEKV